MLRKKKGFSKSVIARMWPTTLILFALVNHWASADYLPNLRENQHVQESSGSRIVSGWESQPGQHPHQVSLRLVRMNGAVSGCGGNVVHKEWLLTAAHCVANQVTIVVRAGVTDMTRPEVFVDTTEYYTYPAYDVSKPQQIQHDDIALIKLQRPLVFSRNLRPIRIQPSSDAYKNYDKEIVYASGFGRTWTNQPHSQYLMWVYLQAISNAECLSVFNTNFVSNTTICAKFFNVTSQSTCFGDDGGPLVHLSPEEVPTLVGISSFVAGQQQGCHSGMPAGFVRPGPYHAWFTEVTGIDFNNFEELTTFDPTVSPTPPSPTTPSPTFPSPTTPISTTPSPTTPARISTTPSPTTPIPTTPIPTTSRPIIPSPTTDPSTDFAPSPTTPTTDKPDTEEDPEISEFLKGFELKVYVNVQLKKYSKKIEKKVVE